MHACDVGYPNFTGLVVFHYLGAPLINPSDPTKNILSNVLLLKGTVLHAA